VPVGAATVRMDLAFLPVRLSDKWNSFSLVPDRELGSS
jgi:hypothetical protein